MKFKKTMTIEIPDDNIPTIVEAIRKLSAETLEKIKTSPEEVENAEALEKECTENLKLVEEDPVKLVMEATNDLWDTTTHNNQMFSFMIFPVEQTPWKKSK